MNRIAQTSFARAGEVNNTSTWYTNGQSDGTATELFLEKFGGEVLTTFAEQNVMMGLHQVRSISSGKSASFPVLGRAKAAYHMPGNDILVDSNGDTIGNHPTLTNAELQDIYHNEVTIYIDGLLTSSVFIHDLDVAMNHWDQAAAYAEELGRALAETFDRHVIYTALAAAEVTTPTVTSNPASYSGETIIDADFKTNGSSAVDTIYQIAQKFDEKNIPRQGRYILVDPATFYQIAKQTDLVNRDFGAGENGNLPAAEVRECAGIWIVKTNHLPSFDGSTSDLEEVSNVSGASGSLFPWANGYSDNSFVNTAAIAFHKSAVGTVKLMDLSVQKDYMVNRQGTLMVARYAMGHGILRPEAAIAVDIA